MIINYRRFIFREKYNFLCRLNCCWWLKVLFRHRYPPSMCCNISWWLSQFCRLHNLWPLHLIEKGRASWLEKYTIPCLRKSTRKSSNFETQKTRFIRKQTHYVLHFTSLSSQSAKREKLRNSNWPSETIVHFMSREIVQNTKNLLKYDILALFIILWDFFSCMITKITHRHMCYFLLLLVTNKLQAIHHHFLLRLRLFHSLEHINSVLLTRVDSFSFVIGGGGRNEGF